MFIIGEMSFKRKNVNFIQNETRHTYDVSYTFYWSSKTTDVDESSTALYLIHPTSMFTVHMTADEKSPVPIKEADEMDEWHEEHLLTMPEYDISEDIKVLPDENKILPIPSVAKLMCQHQPQKRKKV